MWVGDEVAGGRSPSHGGVAADFVARASWGAFQSKRQIMADHRNSGTDGEKPTGRTGSSTMRWGLAGWRLRQQREQRQQSHSRPRVAQAAEAARVAQESVGRNLGSATAGAAVMLTSA